VRATATDLIHLLLALPLQMVLACLAAAAAGWLRGPVSPWFRWRFALLAAAAWTYMLSMPATANALAGWLEAQHPVPADDASLARIGTPRTVLVLSGGWFRPTGSGYEVMFTPADLQRIDTAVALHQRLGARLIFSGAPLPDGSDSVAQRMAARARQMGVPAEAVAVETRSVNTYENLAFSTQAFQLHQAQPVLLVTSALHMPRAVAVARTLGLQVLPYPCDFRAEAPGKWQLWVPSNEGAAALEAALHEVLGLWAYRWSGRA
jgi:uncharacterized SAM-binding protein YcdF (DUF218 family)